MLPRSKLLGYAALAYGLWSLFGKKKKGNKMVSYAAIAYGLYALGYLDGIMPGSTGLNTSGGGGIPTV